MCDMLFDEYDDDPFLAMTCEDCGVVDDGESWDDEQIAYRNILGRHRLCLCYHCYTDRCDAL